MITKCPRSSRRNMEVELDKISDQLEHKVKVCAEVEIENVS